jgi:hypothetical protein
MNRKLIFTLLVLSLALNVYSQRRTIVVPAPQPPSVPLDGGISLLLVGGGILVNRQLKATNS